MKDFNIIANLDIRLGGSGQFLVLIYCYTIGRRTLLSVKSVSILSRL